MAEVAAILVIWVGVEYLTQMLLTRGQVRRRRVLVSAALATMGRAGLIVWSAMVLTSSISHKAESYGPIGVVFALFTGLLAYWVVLLGATLLAAVLTDPDPERHRLAIAGIEPAQRDF